LGKNPNSGDQQTKKQKKGKKIDKRKTYGRTMWDHSEKERGGGEGEGGAGILTQWDHLDLGGGGQKEWTNEKTEFREQEKSWVQTKAGGGKKKPKGRGE